MICVALLLLASSAFVAVIAEGQADSLVSQSAANTCLASADCAEGGVLGETANALLQQDGRVSKLRTELHEHETDATHDSALKLALLTKRSKRRTAELWWGKKKAEMEAAMEAESDATDWGHGQSVNDMEAKQEFANEHGYVAGAANSVPAPAPGPGGHHSSAASGQNAAAAGMMAANGDGCFAPDTEVRMADGSSKALDNLQEGDEILVIPKPQGALEAVARGAQMAFTGSLGEPVKARWLFHAVLKEEYGMGEVPPPGVKVTLSDNTIITTTAKHEFAVHSTLGLKFVTASDLSPGDSLATSDTVVRTVASLQQVSMRGLISPVYDPPGLIVLASGVVMPPITHSDIITDAHQLELIMRWLVQIHKVEQLHPCLLRRIPDGRVVLMLYLMDYLQEHPDSVSETDEDADKFLEYIARHKEEFPRYDLQYCSDDPVLKPVL